MLLLALTFAEVSSVLPVAGGIARVPQFSHGNTVAMIMGWTAWAGYNTAAPIEVQATLTYLQPYAPWLHEAAADGPLSTAGIGVAALLLVLFVVINFYGVRFFAYVNSTITWAKIAVPLLTAGVLWPRISTPTTW